MITKSTVAACAVAATSVFAISQAHAATYDVITGGSVTFELTAPLGDYSLGANYSVPDEGGNPQRSGSIRATGLDDNNVPTGTGSQVLDDGGASLALRLRTLYLYPTDDAGNEVEDFAAVKNFPFSRNPPADIADLININFVPTDDPNVFTDYRNPGDSYTLTNEQVAQLVDGSLRECCRHSLGSFTVNTSGGFVDGVIDNMRERDTNFDGVYDPTPVAEGGDYFHLFTLGATDEQSVFDLVLTDTMATYLNYGFTAAAFGGSDAFINGWAGSPLNFAGGDTIGRLSYSYDVASVSTVPLPAGLPLLIAGLGAMGLVGRRRKKA